jgi:PQQ system protein
MQASNVPVALAVLVLSLLLTGCPYGRLLRPGVIKQLNPDVEQMLNELPQLDQQNKETVAELFALGGLSHAKTSGSGYADRITVPRGHLLWRPAIVVMPHGGDLQLDFSNDDDNHHIAMLPSDGDRQVLHLPPKTGGTVRLHLSNPGMYWFGCPVANHAGRGMLGLIIVGGDVPGDAKLDRPTQPRPR